MLAPNDRVVYLEMLRPPPGYHLDLALATTYTLDLASLLLAPLTMTVYDCDDPLAHLRRPLQTLDALRRTSERLVVFCHAAATKIPDVDQPLYSYLEPAVVGVLPEDKQGTFHPKIWVLRYENADRSVRYRFACLSRNLTFDRSWDSALVLEGPLRGRRRKLNRPLAEFVSALPTMAVEKAPRHVTALTGILAEEIPKVEFEMPEGFRPDYAELELIPIFGQRNRASGLGIDYCRRLVVVSPFLADSQVQHLAGLANQEFILVSRQDELDALSDATMEELEEVDAQLFVMNEDAAIDEDESPVDGETAAHPDAQTQPEASTDERAGDEKSELEQHQHRAGLHAKLYIAEENARRVDLYTGSANATHAALEGGNVEFMVRLRETAKVLNIDRLLGRTDDARSTPMSFRDTLVPYEPSDLDRGEVSTQRKLDRALRVVSRSLAELRLRIFAEARADGTYDMRLQADRILELPPNLLDLTITCWPISLHERHALEWPVEDSEACVTFLRIAPIHLTQFIAFTIEGVMDDEPVSTELVLNVPAEGFPEDRPALVLREIIQNQEAFFQYLMMLLAPDAIGPDILELGDGGAPWNSTMGSGLFEQPIFEQLVRAYSRNPERIDDVTELISELESAEETQDVLPPRFLELWQAFVEAREEDR